MLKKGKSVSEDIEIGRQSSFHEASKPGGSLKESYPNKNTENLSRQLLSI